MPLHKQTNQHYFIEERFFDLLGMRKQDGLTRMVKCSPMPTIISSNCQNHTFYMHLSYLQLLFILFILFVWYAKTRRYNYHGKILLCRQ